MKIRKHRVRMLAVILPIAGVALVAAFHTKSTAAQRAAITVYYTHGRIYTNDPAQPWADAMAVSEGKITCIGKTDHVLLDCGGGQEGVETVNLRGQFVMPGFNDAHVHLGGAGADELAVPLTGVPSAEEMQKRVATAVALHKPGEWITERMGPYPLAREKVPESAATGCRGAKESRHPHTHFRPRGCRELARP